MGSCLTVFTFIFSQIIIYVIENWFTDKEDFVRDSGENLPDRGCVVESKSLVTSEHRDCSWEQWFDTVECRPLSRWFKSAMATLFRTEPLPGRVSWDLVNLNTYGEITSTRDSYIGRTTFLHVIIYAFKQHSTYYVVGHKLRLDKIQHGLYNV